MFVPYVLEFRNITLPSSNSFEVPRIELCDGSIENCDIRMTQLLLQYSLHPPEMISTRKRTIASM